MIKALCKKAKGNKGFTLIEVIVVLAILGILALILVPRLGGYTKRAKEKADEATARSIKTAVEALVANGEIKGSGEINIPNEGEITTTITGFEGDKLKELKSKLEDLIGLIGKDVKSQTKSGFRVEVDSDFNVTCEATDDLKGSGSESKPESEPE